MIRSFLPAKGQRSAAATVPLMGSACHGGSKLSGHTRHISPR
jgi:hypothetical protein